MKMKKNGHFFQFVFFLDQFSDKSDKKCDRSDRGGLRQSWARGVYKKRVTQGSVLYWNVSCARAVHILLFEIISSVF